MKVRPMAVAMAVVALALQVRADITYYVALGGDGTAPTSGDLAKAYAHPQDAIDAATGEELTTIIVEDGTYVVRTYATDTSVIDIAKSNVRLVAHNARQAIIDGGTYAAGYATLKAKLTNRAVTTAPDLSGVSIEGFVFKNGVTVSNQKATTFASTAYAQSGTFVNCEFIGYAYRYSDPMRFAGTAVARGCRFACRTDCVNDAVVSDYGLSVDGTAQILDSTIEELAWIPRYPIYPISLAGSGVISNCVIRNNMFGSPNGIQTKGYGSRTASGTISMSGGTLWDCVISNNVANGNGGGVYVTSSAATIRGCVFWGNHATAEHDNIFVKAGVSPTIVNTTAPDLQPDASGNTNFEPFQEFCTEDSVSVGKAPFTVTFRNKGGVDATWDFGDDSGTEWGATPEHTYDQPGVYTVKMTVNAVETERKDYIVVTGPKMYVAKDGSGTKPYDTPAKAALHPQDAIDLAPDGAGTEIEIDDGTYEVRDPKDFSILTIAKNGLTLKAKNGQGHVWIDSKRAAGNKLGRRNVLMGGGFSDVTLEGLVLTNGWTVYNVDGGASCAVAGSGTFRDCAFDLYCFQFSIGVIAGGEAHFENCRFGGKNTSKNIWSNSDYGISLAGSAVLDHCVLWGLDLSGNTLSNPYVNMSSDGAVMRNCLVTGFKGGKTGSTKGCGAIVASKGTIENCTIVKNDVQGGSGGGVRLTSGSVVFRNNIVWGNTASGDHEDIDATDYSCCTYSAASDLAPTEANQNVRLDSAVNPGFTNPEAGDWTIGTETLMTGKGLVQGWMEGATDLAGAPRLYEDTVSMGCYEPQGRSTKLIGSFSVTSAGFGPPPFEASFGSTVQGGSGVYLYQWDFGDGTVTDWIATGAPKHTYEKVGAYTVHLNVKDGDQVTDFGDIVNAVVAVGDTCYVRPDQAGVPPYDTWEKATSNIEAAVKLQPSTVLATNGTYYLLDVTVKEGLNLNRAMTVRSVEGPEKTCLSRTADAKGGVRDTELHLATLTDADALLDGFTLAEAVPPAVDATAGLVRNCIATNFHKSFNQPLVRLSGTAVISNCVVDATGAIFGDTQATVAMMSAGGSAQVLNCEFKNLTHTGNADNDWDRSGVILSGSAVLRNCFVHDVRFACNEERAKRGLAGIYATGDSKVDNCTVTRCWSKYNPGGGINVGAGATVRNCIAYGNTGGGTSQGTDDEPIDIRGGLAPAVFANNLVGTSEDGELPETATDCLPLGTDPMFVDSGYRLDRKSPCINAGKRLEWTRNSVDIEGNVRRGSRPDIGCWESDVKPGLSLMVR